MTVEDRVKLVIGQLVIEKLAMQQQIEDLQAKQKAPADEPKPKEA